MHLKKNQILVLYWVILFGFVTGSFAKKFGIPYLFLDPEYMGEVDGRAFFLTGLATGAFTMAFNVASFMLNSFRFPFLASLNNTFQKYTLNNFIIPATFILVYAGCIFYFQYENQLKTPGAILINIFFFLFGISIIIFSTWKYYLLTNKDIYKLFGIDHAESENYEMLLAKKKAIKRKKLNNRAWRVDTYLTLPLKNRLVRSTAHYKPHMLESVLRQNHLNASVVEMILFFVFIMLGFFRDYPLFKIPASASVLFLFTIILMLSGVFRYWLRAWANTAFVAAFLLLNLMSQFEIFNARNQAYGINYKTEKPVYDIPNLQQQVLPAQIKKDTDNTLVILENWKKKWQLKGVQKPKMVLLNVSGGGLRSTVFTFRTMQAIDSMLNGELMNHTQLITGSSGGMIGAGYYRALYLEQPEELMKANRNINNHHLENVGKDLLNTLAFSLTVSDLFLNMQSFKDGNYRYVKDRAFAFEKQLNENTGNVMNKRIRDYELPETASEIPMMVISPTIINDGRSVLISSQPCSYLLQHYAEENDFKAVPDGMVFSNFFAGQDADNLKFTSALRLNATFPYIMPAASLPSDPAIEVTDAGLRDNYGITSTLRFLRTFNEWLDDNTSGVVIIQIRDNYKAAGIAKTGKNTIFEKLMAPFRNITGNFILMQDYYNDNNLLAARQWVDCPLDFVQFEMPEMEEKISLSWHLTNKEKNLIKNAMSYRANHAALEKLKKILYIHVFAEQPQIN